MHLQHINSGVRLYGVKFTEAVILLYTPQAPTSGSMENGKRSCDASVADKLSPLNNTKSIISLRSCDLRFSAFSVLKGDYFDQAHDMRSEVTPHLNGRRMVRPTFPEAFTSFSPSC